MTDNDIIKALTCCTTKGSRCVDCPAWVNIDRSNCKKFFRGAIDLIDRQKAEIERLKQEKDNLIKTYAECQTEAIKEFAERLKQGLPSWLHPYVDTVEKEMVGDE